MEFNLLLISFVEGFALELLSAWKVEKGTRARCLLGFWWDKEDKEIGIDLLYFYFMKGY